MTNRAAGWLIFLFVSVASATCALREGTPAALPETASPDLFSADRAAVYLNGFATAPHPVGSAEHDRVRDYLAARLTALGVTPEIQKATGVTARYEVAGTVENVFARLKGTSGAPDAVSLTAHYDSVAAGPGAADDGAGVAALLETLRALRAGPALRNDVIFVFTDGEEDGLLGASAFVEENAAAKDLRVVLNFDNRGNAGESQLFETSAGNGRLVRMFARSARYPVGSSLSYEIYKRLPNDTDMTVFKKAGAAGLNFGFIGHWEAYHTPLDNPQTFDRGSLQQEGEDALSLARSLGNADLTQLRDTDVVYFSIPGNIFVKYSSRFIWPIAAGTGIFLLAIFFYANGAWQTRLGGIVTSFILQTGVLVVLLLIGIGLVSAARWMHLHVLQEGGIYQSKSYALGLLALLASAQAMFWKLSRKRISSPALFLGAAVLLAALVVVSSNWLPGGSYVLAWPLLAALLATAVAAFRPGQISIPSVVILCVLSLPALLLFVPLLEGFYLALGFTTMGAPLLSITFGLLFLSLMPFLEPVLESDGKSLAILSLAAAVVLCIVAARTTKYSREHPKPSVLAYALDADTGKALWTSSVARVDSWTAQYLDSSSTRGKLPDFYPAWYPTEFFQQAAPALALEPPQAELLGKSSDNTTRTLHFRISTPRHARTIHLGLPQSEVLNATVNGRELGRPSEARWHQAGHWGFDYVNPPSEGIDVQLQVQGLGQVTLVLVDRSSGLPSIPGEGYLPRPADSMPINSGDQTMVRRSFVF